MELAGYRVERLIGSPKLQIIFHKRATKYRSLLQKMTYKDKGSYESSPPCNSTIAAIQTPILLYSPDFSIRRVVCLLLRDSETSATLCNTLQHSATLCNTLQHSATHKSTYRRPPSFQREKDRCNNCNTLQRANLHITGHLLQRERDQNMGNTLQHTATK